ncbi:hypothetical protein O181_019122 [Austropuccinia psidii MF-1]|uniref:Wbp11/ELF5/Saf1 N-terminal domain-containing protein n=1 Tax=Austropuccinia psidii MF-1 TaxID=1389203 RepID=A0A9Q3C943_9BASI|nr:hypothetical protein [Austropuccinia psidii MF-1]
MAKKLKSLNPADAYRKAQRQKEIKRNKLDRKKARENAKTNKDSTAIQAEINQLERLSKPTLSEQNRLKDLKTQLISILEAKSQISLSSSSQSNQSTSQLIIIDPATGLPTNPSNQPNNNNNGNNPSNSISKPSNPTTVDWFGPDGKLLEPEKSLYYDPIFNPFGVPPPGMPMRLKVQENHMITSSTSQNHSLSIDQDLNHQNLNLTHHKDQTSNLLLDSNNITKLNVSHTNQNIDQHLQDNVNQDDHDDADNNNNNNNDSDDDDDDDDQDLIPLPDGSPPHRASSDEQSDDEISLPDGPPPPKPFVISPQHKFINRSPKLSNHIPNHLPHSYPHFIHPPSFVPPPITLVPGLPPPSIIAGLGHLPFPLGPNGLPLPPPPLNFQSLPIPPPLANLPLKPPTSISSFPSTPSVQAIKPSIQSAVTVKALPQLRDLKREATSFVPNAIRKKRKELDRRAGLAGLGSSNRIQAAPDAFNHGEIAHTLGSHDDRINSLDSTQPKPMPTSLLSALKRDGIVSATPAVKNTLSTVNNEKDDYEKFVESLGDVL